SDPIVFPAAPCVTVHRIEEIALNPRRASIKTDPDLGDIGIASPGSTVNGVRAIGFEPLVHPRTCDLGFQSHLCERSTDRYSRGIVPIGVVGRLPVALEGLSGSNNVGQPLDGRHAVVPRHYGAHWIAVI